MAIPSYVKTAYVNDQAPALDADNMNKSESGIFDVTEEVISLETQIGDLGSPDSIKFTPQATAPTYQEGQVYYDQDTGALSVQGKYSDATLQIGVEQYVTVVNNSGADILNGAACRHNGVVGGVIQVELALADNLTHSRVLGIATHLIPNGSEGQLTTYGMVSNFDTSALPLGVPLYLSDTVAGTYTEVPPDIASQIGGALIQNATTGQIIVKILNNIALPTVTAYMNQGSCATDIGTVAQTVTNYQATGNVVLPFDPVAGTITTPSSGIYSATANISVSFNSIGNSVESLTLRLVGDAGTDLPIDATIPRNGEHTSMYPSISFNATAGETFHLELSSSVALSAVTFDLVTFDITSKNIR